MNTPFELKDRHILVTGASSGIGRATAVLCAAVGAKLSIVGRDDCRLNETMAMLEGTGHQQFLCDLNDDEALVSMVDELGSLDGAVFCAGTQSNCIVKALDRANLDKVFETNFFSTVALSKRLLEKKKISRGASLVYVSSVAAVRVAEVGNAAYSASKAAILSFAKVLATELAPRRIRVNTVAPGMVRTSMLSKFDFTEEDFAEDEKRYPLGYGEPEDVANAIAFLLSGASRWITGTEILLDGGLTLK